MIYTAEQAQKYRECDENPDDTVKHFGEQIAKLCPSHGNVIDLGCGTGRYFRYIPSNLHLTGIDPSPAMIAEAVNPAEGREAKILAISTLDKWAFGWSAKLMYSVGVLAEHIGLTVDILNAMWALSDKVYFTAEKTKAGKEETVSRKGLEDMMVASNFGGKWGGWNITEWKTDNEFFKGTHFEVIAE